MPKDEEPKKIGRPTVMTVEMIATLREAYLLGCTDSEACGYANISEKTLYNYQKAHPDFIQQKQQWQDTPILKARKTIVDDLQEPETAKWYLERKRKKEFATRQEVEGAIGGAEIIEQWKREAGIDESSLSSLPDVDEGDVQSDTLSVPERDNEANPQSVPV